MGISTSNATNYSPTLSLNHNWFNAACLQRMYESLCREHELSMHAIRDLRHDMDGREFEMLVQGLLKANYGMDWEHWWELVEWNYRNRGDENRMDQAEEREIVLRILREWLGREEVSFLPEIRTCVLAFHDYLSREGLTDTMSV